MIGTDDDDGDRFDLRLLQLQVNEKVVTIDYFVDVATNNETALQEAVVSQPVTVSASFIHKMG